MKKVWACDIDKVKVDHMLKNCEIYNCKDRVEGIVSDYLKLQAKDLEGFDPNGETAVFLSPPWGGESYGALDTYSVDCMFPSFRDTVK